MQGYLIAMSGGVDSGVAADLILRSIPPNENGITNVCGVTLTMGFDNDEQNAADAAAVAHRLGLDHKIAPCAERFRRDVIDYFSRTYAVGRTPNPCILCNRAIKFDFLSEEADRLGLYHIATGHYARRDTLNGRPIIRKAADGAKDQSYVLAMLTKEQVARAVFPLGALTKREVREMAAERGFITAGKHDSQDICFIPDGDYVGFLSRSCGITPTPGKYLDKDGRVLGDHKGQLCYTIGQRKGLGIALGRHMFVLEKDAAQNTVVLGDEADLFRTQVILTDFNVQGADTVADLDGLRFSVKLRYSQRQAEALVHAVGEHRLLLEFDESQRAPSPGQFGVLYADDILIGGGEIV